MSTLDNIHSAQERVQGMQQQLDDVQGVLERAERIAAAGEEAKRTARRLLIVSVVLLAAAVGIAAMRRPKRPASD